MKKVLLTIALIIGITAGVSFGVNASKAGNTHEVKQVLSTQSNQKVVASNSNGPGLPKIIQIPKISLNTVVESVGLDSEGRMDVPEKAENTAWFKLGYRPGQKGNAVLDGHYDKLDGSPAVFWDIPKLAKGDEIIITDDKGEKKTFTVTRIVKYPYDKLPMQEVFGESSKSMLNLITCQGKWDEKAKNYSDRMVVYSQLVD